ncbi:MAG: thiolase family protein [Polyangiaceae bacterium]|nr:thiolase family protein [Polyangiaceae bacterium]
MSNLEAVYLVGAARTPIGSYLGALSSLSAPRLGAVALRAALERAGVAPADVEEVVMGNVLSAGIGQAPARQASIFSGIPNTVPATTVNKVCGSGLQAVAMARKSLMLGEAALAVAGGMESMSNVPYYLTKARTGYRMGNDQLVDGMIFDGLWDPYNDFHMGRAGELCAKEFKLDRQSQDAFATESYDRALKAQAAGEFRAEIAPVEIAQKKGPALVVDTDEEPGRGDPKKFAALRPAFDPAGTITAANASSVNDGAAAVVLATESAVKARSLTPLARIVGTGYAAHEPEWFTTAPAKAMQGLLTRLNLSTKDVDLWEINEAFSCVTQACSSLLKLDPATVNVRGGAVALGHPIGASGARVLTTLLYAMKDRGARRGVASLCIGGGEAIAMLIEAV